MKLAFMGTPAFALPSLKALIASQDHEVALVITQPDKPRGRSLELLMPPVKETALHHGIPVIQPEKIKGNREVLETIRGLEADAVIVVAYGKMIPDEMLQVPRHGFINVHASLLPSFRGAAPINRAILAGCRKTGVSIMQIDSGMDSGPVFMEEELPIEETDDAVSLSEKLSVLGAEKLLETLARIEEGSIHAVPQRHEEATYAPMLTRDDGRIDWNMDALTINNMIRGLVPWPSAYTYLGSKTLKILSGTYSTESHEKKPGTMLKDGQGVRICCRGGFIIPDRLQLEGKKIMDGRAFSCGLHTDMLLLGADVSL